MGDRVYWITSHGRNKDGKPRPNRYRFFATTVRVSGASVEVKEVGVPYCRLVDALVADASTRGLGLDRATRLHGGELNRNSRERLAPKQEGLNIEGLCATPDGETLYIGLRNPRVPGTEGPGSRAIVVPLRNAAAVVEKGETPQFGPPVLWDLAGLGIRSMVYSEHPKAFYVVAGPHDARLGFALYRWSGDHAKPPVFVRRLDAEGPAWQAEALVAFADSARLLALSDDGAVPVKVSGPAECMEGEYRGDGTCDNKFLRDEARRFFRGTWLAP